MNPRQAAKHDDQRPHSLKKDHDEWGMPAPPERASLTPPIYLLCSSILAVAMTLKPWVIMTAASTHICPNDILSRIVGLSVPMMSLIVDFYLLLKLVSLTKTTAGEEPSYLEPGNVIAAILVVSQSMY